MRKGCFIRNCAGIKTRVAAIFAILFSVIAASGQTPPPNDNYSNSITLTGTDIIFSGTLAGATLEDQQETLTEYDTFISAIPTESIWWNWTAPEDMMLTLEIVNTSFDGTFPSTNCDGLFVYTATNGSSTPAGLVLPAIGYAKTIPRFAPQTFSVPVSSGSNYQIQLMGNSAANYTIQLQATKTPVIITQPRSQTVYSNAAALFYVVYAGVDQTNFTFQWYFNGTNLPGETAPMLALTNIDSSMAGSYTVTVSNGAGATLSAPATLTVSQSNFPVSLAAAGTVSNSFVFSVAGEAGRSYRLQSSIDLTNWAPLAILPMSPIDLGATSVFIETNQSQILNVPNTAAAQFFRVTPYVISAPDAAICINNLEQIRIAKMLWQRDYDPIYYVTATPIRSEIAPYFPHQTLPFCPDDLDQRFDYSYSINNLQTEPTCLMSTNHVLIEPR